MISDEDIEEITTQLLQESFINYFQKAKKETKHIILDRLFPTERRTTSTMTGLQTSLGTFWEKLSKKLAEKNEFKVLDTQTLKRPSPVPTELMALINEHKEKRQNTGGELTQFKQQLNGLYSAANRSATYININKGKGADLILEKDANVYLYDIKTVQINANGGNSFNETLILWTAYYKYQYGIDANNIHSRLVFPYNSGNELDDNAWWKDFGSRVAPLTQNDVQVGNEFWAFITGNSDALNCIISAVEGLAQDQQFIELYQQVFDCENYDQLVQFSQNVKLHKIKQKFSVELLPYTPPLNLAMKLEWQHGQECVFREKINKLFTTDQYICPVCNVSL